MLCRAGHPPGSKAPSRFFGLSPGQSRALEEAQKCSPVPPKKKDVRSRVQQNKEEIRAEKKSCKAKAKTKAKAKAKAKAKCKAKAKAQPKAKGKAQAKAQAQVEAGGLIYKVTLASKQSYICIQDPVTKVRQLWVAVSAAQHADHQNLIKSIHLQKPQSKAEALAMRSTALE